MKECVCVCVRVRVRVRVRVCVCILKTLTIKNFYFEIATKCYKLNNYEETASSWIKHDNFKIEKLKKYFFF